MKPIPTCSACGSSYSTHPKKALVLIQIEHPKTKRLEWVCAGECPGPLPKGSGKEV
jgi:hypothetical protein